MSERYTVENLNPRSKPVQSLVSACKRALALRSLLNDLNVYMSVEEIKSAPPWAWGALDGRSLVVRTKEIWGEKYRECPDLRPDNWVYLVDQWDNGSLDRQIRDMAANLPETAREKLDI